MKIEREEVQQLRNQLEAADSHAKNLEAIIDANAKWLDPDDAADLTSAHMAGYATGAEQMRRRAADAVRRSTGDPITIDRVAAKIEALPLVETAE